MATSKLDSNTISAPEFIWNIEAIVSELRAQREASLAARRRRGNSVKLPSRKLLTDVVDNLIAALFPNRLGSRVLAHESIDYFVGHLLDESLCELAEQVARELHFDASGDTEAEMQRERAVIIVRAFAEELPRIRMLLDCDIEAAFEGDPAARSIDEVLACYPGVMAIAHYRLAHALFGLGAPLVARIISEIAHSVTGIDIHPRARIGRSFFIDHGTGVVIGETAVIGERVRLYHGVTLGARHFPVDDDGVLLKGNERHPIVEDEVVIYAGATILGRVTIGRGSVIGGNVWLTRSVPAQSNISQAKVRNEVFDSGAGI
jgi:serine O-acetyltransferase